MSRVLVTGSTGYVGGRLVPALLERGYDVSCLVRTPSKLQSAPWVDDVRIIPGELRSVTAETFQDCDVAIYLVHSIGQGDNWATEEVLDARQFSHAAREAGVSRIVFLGGLGDDRDELSPHLHSRHAVGDELRRSGLPVIELRAGVVIGSGSASFEMLRYLVEVLPIMVTPKWVDTKCQPIAISDTIATLVAAVEQTAAGIYEIGGADVVSYAEMMATYADVAGLPRRRLIRVPLLTPRLSSHWVGLVTPVPVPLAKELVESLVNEVVVHPGREAPFGPAHPLTLRQSIERALLATNEHRVPTRFVDADLVHFATRPTDPEWSGGTVRADVRRQVIAAPRADVFRAISSVGGEHGWFSGDWMWRIRGVADQLVGGPGLRRGRPDVIAVGDALDFWRVDELVPNERLRLRAEMKLPGEAFLTWELRDVDGRTEVVQTALFRPRGLSGRLYWFAVAPFHGLVFPGMLRGIARDATRP